MMAYLQVVVAAREPAATALVVFRRLHLLQDGALGRLEGARVRLHMNGGARLQLALLVCSRRVFNRVD